MPGCLKLSVAALGLAVTAAQAADVGRSGAEPAPRKNWFSGDWYLTVGATGFVAPRFEGAKDLLLGVTPIISLGRAGPEARFTSRNDNISLAFVDKGAFRAGAAGKVVWGRDDVDGLEDVSWGAEAGVFAEIYPADWLRLRAELLQGIRAHHGVVADLAADAFTDLTPVLRLSGGPRASWASKDFFDAYYGVSGAEAADSGLAAYAPGGGWRSAGAGGALTWKAGDRTTASVFAEYSRLLGPGADSSLVREKGSADQFTAGVSATYRFDLFSIP